jgi:hypothetical protein
MSGSKAFLLIPFTIGASAWLVIFLARKTNRDMVALAAPGYAILGLVLAIGGMIAIGEIFPRFSINNFASQVAHLQEVGARTQGGSNYAIVETEGELTVAQQIAYAPSALILSLFRPFIFEARNPFALLSALESSFALIMLFLAVRRRGFRGMWRQIVGSPTLLYCTIIVLLVSFGVGLTTTNFGTLSRYRIPMMPMYFVLVTMLAAAPRAAPQRARLLARRFSNRSSQR